MDRDDVHFVVIVFLLNKIGRFVSRFPMNRDLRFFRYLYGKIDQDLEDYIAKELKINIHLNQVHPLTIANICDYCLELVKTSECEPVKYVETLLTNYQGY